MVASRASNETPATNGHTLFDTEVLGATGPFMRSKDNAESHKGQKTWELFKRTFFCLKEPKNHFLNARLATRRAHSWHSQQPQKAKEGHCALSRVGDVSKVTKPHGEEECQARLTVLGTPLLGPSSTKQSIGEGESERSWIIHSSLDCFLRICEMTF